jgi:sulfatase modifying factor 1
VTTAVRTQFLAIICGLALSSLGQANQQAAAPPTGMRLVPQGVYRPLFRGKDGPKEVPVKTFYLDALPITNAEFLEFVRANPRWQRSQVKRLFADEGYLTHWGGDLDLGPASIELVNRRTVPSPSLPSDGGEEARLLQIPRLPTPSSQGEEEEYARVARQPVTRISWFAAKAYAAWRGKRLPTIAEWEYAAGAGFSRADGTNDVEFVRAINTWYSTPTPKVLPAVASGKANFYGVHDLHGLVWEWTSDFNSAMITGDARGDTGLERQLFCGAGSQGASDPGNFPAFMRFGYRSSLKAGYTVHNLGFRCAKDLAAAK